MQVVARPPNEVFENPPTFTLDDRLKAIGAMEQANWVKTTCSKRGGMFSHFENIPVPKKGHPYPEAVEAVNVMKRLAMFFTAFASPRNLLHRVLFNASRLADYLLNPHYLKYQYYTDCSRGLWDITKVFLMELGIEAELANKIGKIVATLFEYDEAYRFRLEDLMTESSKEALLKNPRKEIKRLMVIYSQREELFLLGTAGDKMLSVAKLLSFLLLIPKVKRAFKTAISQVDFKLLQMDKIDWYCCLAREDYKFFGLPLETRLAVLSRL